MVNRLCSTMLLAGTIPFLLFCAREKSDSDGKSRSLRLTWSAQQLFMNSTSRGLMLTEEGITLENQMLIEDDAPACGYSSVPGSLEILREGVILKKILHLDEDPVAPARIALMVYPDYPPQPNNGRHLVFTVNGHDISHEVNHFWTDVPVPVSSLQRGDNTITVRTLEPDTRFKTWVALAENYGIGALDRPVHPDKSARSTDGGKSWDFEHLGEKGTVDGEYSLRLKLANYQPAGWLDSPVIDMAANSDIGGLRQPVGMESAALALQLEIPDHSRIELLARTGATHFVTAGEWSGWEICPDLKVPAALLSPGKRFLQFRVRFLRRNPSSTPVLKQIDVVTCYHLEEGDRAAGIQVTRLVNKPRLASSLDFSYENPNHPNLAKLRQKYHLDEVIAGSTSEFEKMVRLKSWVARQWHWHLLKGDEDIVEWDALKILSPGETGEAAGGFCLHYAIVYLQVLQSFGFQARIVNTNFSIWSGHEVVEVWSNEYGKWIFMDPNFDTYFIDRSTGTPLNVLEMHALFLSIYYPERVLDRNDWSREKFVARTESVGKPAAVDCVVGGGANGGTLKQYEWWEPVVELYPYCGGFGLLNAGFMRYLPRNDFYSRPRPIPLNHGRTHWGWTGYYCWYDEQTPRTPEHSQFTNRKNDLYWNLNEVDFSAALTGKGTLALSFTTNCPALSHYRLKVNESVVRVDKDYYQVELVPGDNQVQIQAVDSMGNAGPASILELKYAPLKE